MCNQRQAFGEPFHIFPSSVSGQNVLPSGACLSISVDYTGTKPAEFRLDSDSFVWWILPFMHWLSVWRKWWYSRQGQENI